MTAIILAGGKSQRMGSNKAFLKYGGKTFIEHQVNSLSKILVKSSYLQTMPVHMPA